MHEEEVLGKAYDARLMRRIIGYLRPHKKFVALAFVLILFESGLETLFPWLTKIAIDDYIAVGDLGGLGTVALAYIFVLGVKFLVERAQSLILQNTGQKIMYDL